MVTLGSGSYLVRVASMAVPIGEMQAVQTPSVKNLRRGGKITVMPARRPTASLRLRRLSAELRRLRDEAGLTREEVSHRTGMNETTLYRLENAKGRPQGRTLIALLDLYGITDETQRTELREL